MHDMLIWLHINLGKIHTKPTHVCILIMHAAILTAYPIKCDTSIHM